MTDTLARYNFRLGDQVVIKGWPPSPTLEVVDVNDRALLTLQAPGGALLRVGRLQVTLIDRPRVVRELGHESY